QMAWEDNANLGDNDFNDFIAVVRVGTEPGGPLDVDGDGLWDDWEKFGIDTDGDGVPDMNLSTLLPVDLTGDGDTTDSGEAGADPLCKDVFLEIDWMQDAMHTHRPTDTAIMMAQRAFASSPAMNAPGCVRGATGIALHVDRSNSLPHASVGNSLATHQ